jgi:hypothetical protein
VLKTFFTEQVFMTRQPIAIFWAIVILGLSSLANGSTLINGVAIHSEFGQESFIAALFTPELETNSSKILTSSDLDKQMQVRVLTERLSARRFKSDVD